MSRVIVIGLPELQQQVQTLAGMRWARQALTAAATQIILPAARVYPPERHAPQPFVSARQRRGFFAKLRSGEIQVPYVRTYKLRDDWQVKHGAGISAEVVNKINYNQWEQSAERQTTYHKKTGWNTDDQIAKKSAPDVVKFIDKQLRNITIS